MTSKKRQRRGNSNEDNADICWGETSRQISMRLNMRKSADQNLTKQALCWEIELFENLDQDEDIRCMWELPSIGLFLHLLKNKLNVGEFSQFEVERCLLMPRLSLALRRLMTTLLSTPYQRMGFTKHAKHTNILSFKAWEEKLKKKVEKWYDLMKKTQNIHVVAETFGLDPILFKVLGIKNPFSKRNFEDLSIYQRVVLVKGLCDMCLENHPSLTEEIDSLDPDNLRPKDLGTDIHGNTYIYFHQFYGSEIRIYRQKKLGWEYVDELVENVLKLEGEQIHRNPIDIKLPMEEGVSDDANESEKENESYESDLDFDDELSDASDNDGRNSYISFGTESEVSSVPSEILRLKEEKKRNKAKKKEKEKEKCSAVQKVNGWLSETNMKSVDPDTNAEDIDPDSLLKNKMRDAEDIDSDRLLKNKMGDAEDIKNKMGDAKDIDPDRLLKNKTGDAEDIDPDRLLKNKMGDAEDIDPDRLLKNKMGIKPCEVRLEHLDHFTLEKYMRKRNAANYDRIARKSRHDEQRHSNTGDVTLNQNINNHSQRGKYEKRNNKEKQACQNVNQTCQSVNQTFQNVNPAGRNVNPVGQPISENLSNTFLVTVLNPNISLLCPPISPPPTSSVSDDIQILSTTSDKGQSFKALAATPVKAQSCEKLESPARTVTPTAQNTDTSLSAPDKGQMEDLKILYKALSTLSDKDPNETMSSTAVNTVSYENLLGEIEASVSLAVQNNSAGCKNLSALPSTENSEKLSDLPVKTDNAKTATSDEVEGCENLAALHPLTKNSEELPDLPVKTDNAKTAISAEVVGCENLAALPPESDNSDTLSFVSDKSGNIETVSVASSLLCPAKTPAVSAKSGRSRTLSVSSSEAITLSDDDDNDDDDENDDEDDDEDEEEEISLMGPEMDGFKLVVKSVKDLRDLIDELSEDGKKQKRMRSKVDCCNTDLLENLNKLLNDLEPYEKDIEDYTKIEMIKMMQEYDVTSYKYKKDSEVESSESETSESEEYNSENENQIWNKNTRKKCFNGKRVKGKKMKKKKQEKKERKRRTDDTDDDSDDETEEERGYLTETEDWGTSLRGRARKRRIIPNTVDSDSLWQTKSKKQKPNPAWFTKKKKSETVPDHDSSSVDSQMGTRSQPVQLIDNKENQVSEKPNGGLGPLVQQMAQKGLVKIS